MNRDFLFLSFLALLGLFAINFAYSKKSDCFSPSFIVSDNPTLFATENAPFEPLQEILSKRFTFLGSGNQSYAFLSDDGKTVLKFIKFHCLQYESKSKLNRILTGFNVAYTQDRDHTGLLYLHYPSQMPMETKIQDKAGKNHVIDLSQTLFVLQKKAVPTGEVLSNLLSKGDVLAALEKIDALFAMYTDEFKRGVYDQDHNIIHNTGFTDDGPIRIDFGKLTLDEKVKDPKFATEELKKIAHERLIPWIKRYFPTYEKQIMLQIKY